MACERALEPEMFVVLEMVFQRQGSEGRKS